ncbi:MAG TPA: hypothetical protein V6C65_04885 [Allocoleopsis sp.]
MQQQSGLVDMSQYPNASQLFNTFIKLVQELELFADTRDVKLAFDQEGKVYLIGNGFQEPLQSNLEMVRVEAEMRRIIACYCPRIPPTGYLERQPEE